MRFATLYLPVGLLEVTPSWRDPCLTRASEEILGRVVQTWPNHDTTEGEPMKRFVLASLIALAASQAAGCIITSGDDTGDDAFVSATWQIRSEATNSETTCPPTFDTAALYNQPVDSAGNNA